jgi:CxxC motif-containing protein
MTLSSSTLAPANRTDLVCIVCPLGCTLTASPPSEDSPWQVTGNRCPRGRDYAVTELTDPRRVLTTTVAVSGGALRRLPVKTASAIPKALLRAAAERLAQVRVAAPIRIGEVVLPNLLETGIDVVATRDLPAAGGDAPC